MAKTKKSMLDSKTKTSKKSGNTKVTRKDKDPVELGLGLYKKIKLYNADYQTKIGKDAYYYKNETYEAWVNNAVDLKDLQAFAELYEKLDNSFYQFRTTHSSMKASALQEQLDKATALLAQYEAKLSQLTADKKTARTAARAARKVEVEESE